MRDEEQQKETNPKRDYKTLSHNNSTASLRARIIEEPAAGYK
jgi:hypothetical protein